MNKLKHKYIFYNIIAIALLYALFYHYPFGSRIASGLEIKYGDEFIANHTSRSTVIYLDTSTVSLEEMNLAPIFCNTSERKQMDFILEYKIDCDGVDFTTSDAFWMYNDADGLNTYRYQKNEMPPFDETEQPFTYMKIVKDIAFCKITSSANCKHGIPYGDINEINFLVVNNTNGVDIDEWKKSCKKRTPIHTIKPNTDILYYFDGKLAKDPKQISSLNEVTSIDPIRVKGKGIETAYNVTSKNGHYIKFVYDPSDHDRKLYLQVVPEKKGKEEFKEFQKYIPDPFYIHVTLPARSRELIHQISTTNNFNVKTIRIGSKIKGNCLVKEGEFNGCAYFKDFSHSPKIASISVKDQGSEEYSEYLCFLTPKIKRCISRKLLDLQKDDYKIEYYRIPRISFEPIAFIIIYILLVIGLIFFVIIIFRDLVIWNKIIKYQKFSEQALLDHKNKLTGLINSSEEPALLFFNANIYNNLAFVNLCLIGIIIIIFYS